jgi:hypothetical protein
MLYEESLWFKEVIRQRVKSGALVLNIGSSTKHFIEVEQPYIKQNMFDELQNKNALIKHIDIKQAEGVDLVGDVTDKQFIEQLKQLNPSVIICSNLLEHLTDRKSFCEGLMQIMNDETLLIVSVPYAFPYHEDPIDTLYRPDLKMLQNDFHRLNMLEGEIVDCGYYFQLISSSLNSSQRFRFFLKNLLRAIISFATFNFDKFKQVSWTFKKISATCAVYKAK